jgi:predicted MFS family arabinose efflux permease
MMSLFFGAAGLGRVIGAVSGGMIWHNWGINTVCYISFFLNMAAYVCLVRGIKNWNPEIPGLDDNNKTL